MSWSSGIYLPCSSRVDRLLMLFAWQGYMAITLFTSVVVLHARHQVAILQQPFSDLMWQFETIAMTARLAACSTASQPAGSAERLAAMLQFCHGAFTHMQTPSDDSQAEEPVADKILGYQALLYTLGALNPDLHEVLLHLDPEGIQLVVPCCTVRCTD